MFSKKYPRSCTMFNTSLEDSYTMSSDVLVKFPKTFYGSGGCSAEHWAGIFYINTVPTSEPFARIGEFSFRGGIYV